MNLVIRSHFIRNSSIERHTNFGQVIHFYMKVKICNLNVVTINWSAAFCSSIEEKDS